MESGHLFSYTSRPGAPQLSTKLKLNDFKVSVRQQFSDREIEKCIRKHLLKSIFCYKIYLHKQKVKVSMLTSLDYLQHDTYDHFSYFVCNVLNLNSDLLYH